MWPSSGRTTTGCSSTMTPSISSKRPPYSRALDRRSSRLAAPRQATSSSIRRQHGTGRMGTGSATAPRMLTAAHSRVRPGFGSGRPEAAAPLSPAVNAVARRQSGAPRAHRRLSHRFRRAARALGLVIPIVLCVPTRNSNSQLSGSGQVVCCLQLYTIRAIWYRSAATRVPVCNKKSLPCVQPAMPVIVSVADTRHSQGARCLRGEDL
mmetsp:Transcript_21654/g.69939  ORF Transcript_21654/g.69939 Transcript_21654/m.69939 type:complete len:208 (-) Transcript_21654:419-1042(-)